jgi:hypothetical protein
MPAVRAKFRVNNVTPYTDQSGKPNGYRVDMAPVYDSNPESENAKFFQATPWGQITLGVMNPAAAGAFTPGAEFYVDFTPKAD